jgi:hypothetical protein
MFVSCATTPSEKSLRNMNRRGKASSDDHADITDMGVCLDKL